ncbi:MAG: hypothetical protein FWH52_06465, partial [Synergistaceae bacterium]|nr:hypothetical protein [Synergistaceae bacterium]
AILDEILGENGYTRRTNNDAETELNNAGNITITREESNNRMQDEHSASSGVASCARRHIQEKFQPAESAKKLSALYRKISGGKG